jgi:hypothetical protein
MSEKMKETSAKDVTGFLLSTIGGRHSFRIYHDGNFTDYDLAAEDIKVFITDDSAALYEANERHDRLLDYTAKVLGNKPGTELPAIGVTGFLLYSPFTYRHFFRIYGEADPARRKTYKDYKLGINEMEVKILAGGLSFYEDNGNNRLDWSSKHLKPKCGD